MRLLNNIYVVLTCFLTIFCLASIIKLDNNLFEQNVNSSFTTKYVALTFDDGPKKSTTEKLLDGLEERGAKATFFILGESANLYQDIIKRMFEDGHQIGNHTYNHKNLKSLSKEAIEYQINETNKIVEEITGEAPKILRPSYGLYNKKVKEINIMPIILWSIDTNDWKIKNAEKLFNNNVDKIKDGDIVLMHDIFNSSVEAALMIIDELQKNGFVFVTIEDLAKIKGINLIEDEVYFNFCK